MKLTKRFFPRLYKNQNEVVTYKKLDRMQEQIDRLEMLVTQLRKLKRTRIVN